MKYYKLTFMKLPKTTIFRFLLPRCKFQLQWIIQNLLDCSESSEVLADTFKFSTEKENFLHEEIT